MKTRLDTAQTIGVFVLAAACMATGMGIGYAWGSDVPAGAYIITPVPSVTPSPIDRIERGAPCRCADRSVNR